jgi:hypothetical protein
MTSTSAGEGQQPRQAGATRLTWTTKMETTLLESLLSAVGEGKGADGGFKSQIWDPVLKALRKAYPSLSFEQR